MTAADPGLLRAILEQPFDDTARLIYADWLEEHGEAERAEFIRCELLNDYWASQAGEVVWWPAGGRTITGSEAGAALARAQRLLGKHEQQWLADSPLAVPGQCLIEFQRGFPEVVCCHANYWGTKYGNGRKMVCTYPVTRLRLENVPTGYRDYGGGDMRPALWRSGFSHNVWNLICQGRGKEFHFMEFDSINAAQAWVGLVLLNRSRILEGLPPLPTS